MYDDFSRIYARRGFRPDDVGITARNSWVADVGGTPLRRLTEDEISTFHKAWNKLGYPGSVGVNNSSIRYELSPSQTVTITSSAINFTGDVSEEAIRLSVIHAKEHWGSKARLQGSDEKFILRYLACAELLNVEVTSHRVEPAQQDTYQRIMQDLRNNYPPELLGSSGQNSSSMRPTFTPRGGNPEGPPR